MKKKLLSLFLALTLVLSLCPAVFAEEDPYALEKISVNIADYYYGVEGYYYPVEVTVAKNAKLVYGSSGLSDENALVLLIMGDGFLASEQGDFYDAVKNTAKYIMEQPPFNEFTDVIKIYALGVVSNESGAKGEDAESYEAALAEADRDTAFGASFWTAGMQRLIDLTPEGAALGYALQARYKYDADYCLYLINSDTYGGSGGDYCTASLNELSTDIMVHEMGHTIGGLSDEYYAAGYEYENYNLTQESDPTKVPWADFIGKNGIGVYYWGGYRNTGWYVPSLDCKMQYLSYEDYYGISHEYNFCEVCQEQLRKAICADSNVTKLFFQPYAYEFVEGNLPTDMKQFFILRKGAGRDYYGTPIVNEITGDKLGSALTLTYKDSEGNPVEGSPCTAGTYTIVASYNGSLEGYAACTLETTYTISPIELTLSASSKVEDGTPADVTASAWDYTTSTALDYYFDYVFTARDGYSYWYEDTGDHATYNVYYYDDYYTYDWVDCKYTDSAPTEAGDYTVYVTVYDGNGYEIASKSASYTISLDSTWIVNHNTEYPDEGYYSYFGAETYANNQTVIIYGEGYTAAEQEKFEADAAKLVESILATEPFKETQLYFNFLAVNTISGDSVNSGDTFFCLSYDENGVLDKSYQSFGHYAAVNAFDYSYYDLDPYYSANIILVNSDSVQNTVYDAYWGTAWNAYSAIFVTPTEEGAAYAAQKLLSYLTYEPDDPADAEYQRAWLIGYTMYYYDGYDYAPIIVSRAYDETFVYTGLPVDLEPYFHVYNGIDWTTWELIDITGLVPLKLTYYTDNNGKPGTKLDTAPSQPGTYHVKAETIPDPDDYWNYYTTLSDGSAEIGLSRGWTTFTILPRPVIGGGSGSGSTETVELPFVDVGADHVFYDYIRYVYEHNIMLGKGDRFDTVSPLTRAQLVVTLYRMAGSPDISGENLGYPFSDVDPERYYADAIYWARLHGIVNGYEDGTFRPNAPVTRQAMMAILYRYADSLGLDVSVSGSDNLDRFQDGDEVSATMTDAVNWAVEHSFVGGNTAGYLNPAASTTRGAAAKILAGFHQSYIA